jgi:hypothetical protein
MSDPIVSMAEFENVVPFEHPSFTQRALVTS